MSELRAIVLAAGAITLVALIAPDSHAQKDPPAIMTLPLDGVDAKTKNKRIKKLQKAVKKVNGVVSAKVKKKEGLLVVKHRNASPADIVEAVRKAGFKVKTTKPGEDEGPQPGDEDGESAEPEPEPKPEPESTAAQ